MFPFCGQRSVGPITVLTVLDTVSFCGQRLVGPITGLTALDNVSFCGQRSVGPVTVLTALDNVSFLWSKVSRSSSGSDDFVSLMAVMHVGYSVSR